jgi:hypothetical protein
VCAWTEGSLSQSELITDPNDQMTGVSLLTEHTKKRRLLPSIILPSIINHIMGETPHPGYDHPHRYPAEKDEDFKRGDKAKEAPEKVEDKKDVWSNALPDGAPPEEEPVKELWKALDVLEADQEQEEEGKEMVEVLKGWEG